MYKTLVGKPEGKGQNRRPRCRWDGNIKVNLKEIGWEGVDSINLVDDKDQWLAVLNTVIYLWVS
jgi:hypothetical protein